MGCGYIAMFMASSRFNPTNVYIIELLKIGFRNSLSDSSSLSNSSNDLESINGLRHISA
jgi:hypothetical protein